MGGGFTHLCDACPVMREVEDHMAEDDTGWRVSGTTGGIRCIRVN